MTKRHCRPLKNLSRIYKTEVMNYKKIPSVPCDPSLAGVSPFHISIPADKESLVQELENTMEEIQLFSDSSVQGGKVGAATILIRNDKPDCTLYFHLGPKTKHTIHEAKLVGMLLALHLISTEECNAMFCLIAVDNQATLKAFALDMHHLGHHIAWKFLTLANQMQK
jgi:hypothetical protein